MSKINSESLFRDFLEGIFDGDLYMEDYSLSHKSFERAGLLTGNEGLVVRFADGNEFELTIVQSKEVE